MSVYFAGTPEFANYGNWFTKFIFYYIGMTGQRLMYYTPWCLTEAACIACGISYNGTQKENGKLVKKWDAVWCAEILGCELAYTPLIIMSKWNHGTHLWLKNHVQQRLLKPGQKAGLKETLVTFTASSLWHGFYPSYYVMFFNCACMTEIAKDIYRSRVLFEFIPVDLRGPLSNFLSFSILNYCGVYFNQLTLERGNNFARATNYCVLILVPVTLIAIKAIGLVKIAKSREKKKSQ